MGRSMNGVSRALLPPQRAQFSERLADIIDGLSDDQILDLADALHAALRARRAMRVRVSRRVRDRLPTDGVANRPA